MYPQGIQDRYIELECVFKEANLGDIRTKAREIAAWLYTRECEILSFDDEPGLYYRGKYSGKIDFEHVGRMASFTLIFNCEPLAYGGEESKIFVGDSATVNNQGTIETQPRFMATFFNTAEEWKIVNQDGEYIRIVHDFGIGDTLEVNCRTGAILINDTRAMDKLDWQNSRFFPLRVGEGALTVAPGGVCTARVSWIPRYL